MLQTPALFKYAREQLGDEIELCHDVHERLNPSQTVWLAKELEPYRLFFLEDSLPPEQNDHFKHIRNHSAVPIAMGELFVNVHEYLLRGNFYVNLPPLFLGHFSPIFARFFPRFFAVLPILPPRFRKPAPRPRKTFRDGRETVAKRGSKTV